METKIVDTIQQWIPEALERLPADISRDAVSLNYLLLHELAEMCVEVFQNKEEQDVEKVRDIAKIVNLLYQDGNRYTCNAIENEFLMRLASEESPGSLWEHIQLFPSELRRGYLKTIMGSADNLAHEKRDFGN